MSSAYKKLITNINEIFKLDDGRKNADLGHALGVSHFAVHWMILPPGQRSSSPHAEKLEEEFVFVVKGNPHVWINGYIYQLTAGHAVGFPAGTGIAHSFINNSNEEVELIILGERTKKGNKYSYPVNPELHEAHQESIWIDFPAQHLGPHDGKAGNLKHQRQVDDISFVTQVTGANRSLFSYPADSETFTDGIRLTDAIGLKFLGVWHEQLQPKKRTSWPHAHKYEEEFVVILKGNPQVWLNGFLFNLEPGDGVFFPPGSNIAHTLINNSGEVVEYLGIGESERSDELFYPMHPDRNHECSKKNELWEDRPAVKDFGIHNGKPS